MFKSGVSSYLIPQIIRKFGARRDTSTGSKSEETEGPVPSSFVIPPGDNNRLINVSMNENVESFVDISCKQLTYAEVASMAKAQNVGSEHAGGDRPQSSEKVAAGVSGSKSKSGATAMSSPRESKTADDDDVLEQSEQFVPIKCDVSYKKSKQYKHKQFESVQMKKLRQAAFKQESVPARDKRGRQYSRKSVEAENTKHRKKDVFSEKKMQNSLTMD